MVVDAVMSVQQDYERSVVPLVKRFERTPVARSFQALSELTGVDSTMFNSSPRRTATIVGGAKGLALFGSERGLDDEAGACRWAEVTAGLEIAPKADPYVGAVSGINVALLGYLRLLSGQDTIKVDGRSRWAHTGGL